MINEHDGVVLTDDIPDAGLEAGDIGTVVHVHQGGCRLRGRVHDSCRRNRDPRDAAASATGPDPAWSVSL